MTPPLNVDKFIEDIKNRPSLWHKDYPVRLKELQDEWTEISICHGIPQRLLRQKWKSLRETFRMELRKIPKTNDNNFAISPYDFQSQWIHFKQMIFLAGNMRTRETLEEAASKANMKLKNLNGDDSYPLEYVSPLVDSKELLRQQLQQEGESAPSTMQKPPPKKKARYSAPSRVSTRPKVKPKSPTPKPLKTENSVPSPRTDEDVGNVGNKFLNTQDDDYYFLMSLHPYMSKLGQVQKLQTRMDIQNIIFKRLYSEEDF
ncbi:uncharacterized protein LOC129789536 [Lutzomyia longipalpis]|uniref:uncharacterized protein LOC129789536 n=1 Tax=Lutzomyia longipalpis TaxID=7200 RepID=UPI0024843CA9|nr:uncharacterized protein LOC129789536 [Lutzomyia longipalpis]